MAPVREGERRIELALREAGRRVKLVGAGSAAAAWIAGTALFALAFVILDHWLNRGVPDGPRRVATSAYLLAGAAWLAAGLLLPLLRRINHLYLARLVERSHPTCLNTLVDAIQLSSHTELPGSVRAAVVDRAARGLQEVELRRSVSTAGLRRSGGCAAGVLAGLGLYALIAPKPVWPSLLRAFGVSRPAPTWTRIVEADPPDAVSVLRGEPVAFAVRLAGRRPDGVWVQCSLDGGTSWITGDQLALHPPAGGQAGDAWQAVKAGPDVQRTMVWRVVAGDAVSGPRRLEVRPVPVITSIGLRYDYPAYTRLEPVSRAGGEIDAVVGTRVEIRAAASVPIHDPVLVLNPGPNERRRVLDAPSASSPRALATTLTVTQDDAYELRFRDGRRAANRSPIRYPIRARPDAPPSVRIDEPGPDVEMLAEDALNVSGSAEDDYGLTRAVLSYRRTGEGSAVEIPLVLSPSKRAVLEHRLALAEMSAQAGEVIEWWVSVWDNREDDRGKPSYQRRDSDVRRVLIREPEMLAARPPEPEPEAEDDHDEPTPPADSEEPDDREAEGASSEAGESSTDRSAPKPDAEGAEQAAASSSAEQQQTSWPPNSEQQPAVQSARQEADDGPSDPVGAFARAHAEELESLAKHLGTGQADEAHTSPERDREPQGDDSLSANTSPKRQRGSLPEDPSPARTPSPASEGSGQAGTGRVGREAAERRERAASESEGSQGAEADNHAGDNRGDPPGPERLRAEKAQESERRANVPEDEEGDGGATPGRGEASRSPDPDSVQEEGSAAQGAGQGRGDGEGQSPEAGESSPGDSAGGPSPGPPSAGEGPSIGGGGGPEPGTAIPTTPADAPGAQPPVDMPPTPAAGGQKIMAPGRMDRLMETLDHALRRGEVDPALLSDLGWDVPQARQFVQAYERAVTAAVTRRPQRTALPARTTEREAGRDDVPEVLRADEAEGDRGALDASSRLAESNASGLMEVGRQRAPERYRPIVEAYYRSLGSRPAE